jgi:hypothetical protein
LIGTITATSAGWNFVKDKEIKGTVTARTCECCGHHEIGIVTKDGEYIKLELGAKVTIHVTEE